MLFAYSQCCYLFFGSKNKLQKNILKKYLKKNPKNNKNKKMMLKCWKKDKISWEGSKMQKIEI